MSMELRLDQESLDKLTLQQVLNNTISSEFSTLGSWRPAIPNNIQFEDTFTDLSLFQLSTI